MFESVRQESDPVVAVVSTLLFAVVMVGAVTITWRRSVKSRSMVQQSGNGS
jgi:putative spermidine/putrescine transport system permease protein